jgi:predicted nucleotidyltransferase
MNMDILKNKYRNDILRIAKNCSIKSVRVFGSTVRNEAKEESDIDFLISPEENADIFDVGCFKYQLEELLHKKIDIAFENCLHKSIEHEILKEAQYL